MQKPLGQYNHGTEKEPQLSVSGLCGEVESVVQAPAQRSKKRPIHSTWRQSINACLSASEGGRGFSSAFHPKGTNGRNGGLSAKSRDICSGYGAELNRAVSTIYRKPNCFQLGFSFGKSSIFTRTYANCLLSFLLLNLSIPVRFRPK